MKTQNLRNYLYSILILLSVTSCSTINRSMREPETRIEFKKSDFTYSNRVSGEATQVKVIGIDWNRIFKSNSGVFKSPRNASITNLNLNLFSFIPIVGGPQDLEMVQGYAISDLIEKNPDYDVVFYPTFESKTFRVLYFYKKTTVKVNARLAKLSE